MEKQRGNFALNCLIPTFRNLFFFVGFLFFASFLLFYMGTVRLDTHTNKYEPIQPGQPDTGSSLTTTSTSTSSPNVLFAKLAVGAAGTKTLYKPTTLPRYKFRGKRFACWHSCFGPFRKKVFGRPYNRKYRTNNEPELEVVVSSPIPSKEDKAAPSSSSAPGPQLQDGVNKMPLIMHQPNTLDDGEEGESIVMPMQGNLRIKKEANNSPPDYLKLKVRVNQVRTNIQELTILPFPATSDIPTSHWTQPETEDNDPASTSPTKQLPEVGNKASTTEKLEHFYGSYAETTKTTTVMSVEGEADEDEGEMSGETSGESYEENDEKASEGPSLKDETTETSGKKSTIGTTQAATIII